MKDGQYGCMTDSNRRARKPRSRFFRTWQPALERMNEHLEDKYPEVEDEKVSRACEMLFGLPMEVDNDECYLKPGQSPSPPPALPEQALSHPG